MGNMRLPFINSELLYEVPFKAAMNLRGLLQERIQDFKLGGAHLKKIAPSGGRREHFWGISDTCEWKKNCFNIFMIFWIPYL